LFSGRDSRVDCINPPVFFLCLIVERGCFSDFLGVGFVFFCSVSKCKSFDGFSIKKPFTFSIGLGSRVLDSSLLGPSEERPSLNSDELFSFDRFEKNCRRSDCIGRDTELTHVRCTNSMRFCGKHALFFLYLLFPVIFFIF